MTSRRTSTFLESTETISPTVAYALSLMRTGATPERTQQPERTKSGYPPRRSRLHLAHLDIIGAVIVPGSSSQFALARYSACVGRTRFSLYLPSGQPCAALHPALSGCTAHTLCWCTPSLAEG